jgi:hypothetical protein
MQDTCSFSNTLPHVIALLYVVSTLVEASLLCTCAAYHMQAEPPVPSTGDFDTSQTAAAQQGAAQPAVQQLPSHLTQEQYSIAAFKAQLESAAATAGQSQSLTNMFDQSCLLDVLAAESLPLQDRVWLLQEGAGLAAALPVQVLVQLVKKWGKTESWNNTPATNWAAENWGFITTEQVCCRRPSPRESTNPDNHLHLPPTSKHLSAAQSRCFSLSQQLCCLLCLYCALCRPWPSGLCCLDPLMASTQKLTGPTLQH